MTEATQSTPADAVDQKLAMPPALVEAVGDDPELLTKLTRSQLAVVQDRMVRKVLGDPDSSVSQLAVVHERLAKSAQVENKTPPASAQRPPVVINFIRAAGHEQVVIEGEGKSVPETLSTIEHGNEAA